jgi:hypothetical protein
MNSVTEYEKYPQDIWAYLGDMKDMPSRDDRDKLISQAKTDPSQTKRVHLWDYFFRIKEDDVGKPQKAEIARLEQEIRDAQVKHDRQCQAWEKELHSLNELRAVIRREVDRCGAPLEANIRQKIFEERGGKQMRGFFLLGIGVIPVLLGGLLGAATGSGGVTAFFLVVGAVLGGIPGAIGGLLLLSLSGNAEQKIQSMVQAARAERLPILQQNDTAHFHRLNEILALRQSAVEDFNQGTKQRQDRINQLNRDIENLIDQIPPVPTDEQVENWFREDVIKLKKHAVQRSGLEARLETINGIENPICIHCPAGLQPERLSPPFREPNTDRNRHLKAREATFKSNGKAIDFYGVYNFDFILVGKEVLGIYSTVWDFIAGRQIGERFNETGYTKITSIHTFKAYREISFKNSKIELENSPCLSLDFENSSSHTIAFPDLEYMRQTNKSSIEKGWEFDQTNAVENAIKALNERKRIAQNSIK